MKTIDMRNVRHSMVRHAVASLLALLLPVAPAIGATFDVGLWPDGVVPYRFLQDAADAPADCSPNQLDLELCQAHKDQVRRMMNIWEAALRVTDPLGHAIQYVRFVECSFDCPVSYVVVRYNRQGARPESNNMCTYFENGIEKVGRAPNGTTDLHFRNVESANDPGKVQKDQVVLHELGHCLGLWHEQNRSDRERWLDQFATPIYCAVEGANCDGDYQNVATMEPNLVPLLGNYDFDSIMHYPSYNKYGELRWSDPIGNTFLGMTYATDFAPARPLLVSERDVSRVLQYQAREFYARNARTWGFFQSLAVSPLDSTALPDPYLNQAQRVRVVGTPAIAWESAGNYDLFAVGSDNALYWKSFRRTYVVVAYVNYKPVLAERNTQSAWQSIACCFVSDPSAVARAAGRIDVVAINTSGQVQRIKYIDGNWAAPLTLRGGAPTGGLKSAGGGRYVGPAIAARASDLLDVFVVRADGRLAVTTWRNGNWEAWQTLGADYNVTARPAAVALTADQVRLAINETDVNLYEPVVTFGAAAPSFVLGLRRGTIEYRTPPAITTHTGSTANNRYRVLVTNADGRISIRGAVGAWRDIGGIPEPGTGPSAVASGDHTFIAVMNGEDATSCTSPFCHPEVINSAQVIQPGGVWIRYFE